MNPTASRIAVLMGTASLLTMTAALSAKAQTQVAQAQTAQAGAPEAPEEVLITGSLIRGAAAVGVPVTNLGLQDFKTTGAIKTADLFRTVPAANVYPTGDSTNSNGHLERETRVNLRGLDATGPRALMMVDTIRFPPQADGICAIDPSIIPALALDRIDILADGASATYGSDAISGVINIILKRNFDGAITQLQYTAGDNKNHYLASQLWGRTWEGGDIALTYEWYDDSPVPGNTHSKYVNNFTPWGLDDRRPLGSSLPGTISLGGPNVTGPYGSVDGWPNDAPAGGVNYATLGTHCANCYAIPHGTGVNFNPGTSGIGPLAPFSASTLNWGSFGVAGNGGTNGTRNVFNPMALGYEDSGQQRNAAVITLDQRLTKDIQFYGEAFYSNRRVVQINAPGTGTMGSLNQSLAVPTFNPYYPTGAGVPTNLRVNYSFGLEHPGYNNAYELALRYQMGLHVALPYNWNADIYYSESSDANYLNVTGALNKNALSAALGWTIPATIATGTTPAIATWTKPANIPYLNLFCDPTQFTCNSSATLFYAQGLRRFDEKMAINEKGVRFDGPLFDVPGGTVRAAIGGLYDSNKITFTTFDNTGAPTLILPYLHADSPYQLWAGFTQVNVPVFGNDFAFPLVRKLDIEASWRHDQYTGDLVGGTSNPKVGFTWVLSEDAGLSIKGSWGTSFRFANAGEYSPVFSTAIGAFNLPGAVQTLSADNISIQCDAAGNPVLGSGAAKLKPVFGCGATPGALSLGGAPPVSLRPKLANGTFFNGGPVLAPENSINYSIGAEVAPTVFLKGLDVSATWYSIKINGVLVAFNNPTSNSFNDASQGFHYIVPTDLAGAVNGAGCTCNATPTTCAAFQDMVSSILLNPRNAAATLGAQTVVYWINDGGTFNKGFRTVQGLDWTASYDIDLGDFGAWNTGIVGTYYLHNNINTVPGVTPTSDAFHTTLASLAGVAQQGVESLPRVHYRARLGWSNGPWSVTGFVNYDSHFYHTQSVPPNVNNQCTMTGGSTPGGLSNGNFPCAISGYSNIEPSQYLFDLSIGYDTGDMPANQYLKNLAINFIIRNIAGRHPAFEYGPSNSGRTQAAYDILKSDDGRTFNLVLTKTW
jgi:outer membrane receptor protein involved in Fe transport